MARVVCRCGCGGLLVVIEGLCEARILPGWRGYLFTAQDPLRGGLDSLAWQEGASRQVVSRLSIRNTEIRYLKVVHG